MFYETIVTNKYILINVKHINNINIFINFVQCWYKFSEH
jgi:hypothetical protein